MPRDKRLSLGYRGDGAPKRPVHRRVPVVDQTLVWSCLLHQLRESVLLLADL